jgi:type II secretory pathway pseudopilin PulG
MNRHPRPRDGFAFYELLLVMALTAILAGVLYVNFSNADKTARESALKSNLAKIRVAITRYHEDHGFYPCSKGAESSGADSELFISQLVWCTDSEGRVNREKTDVFRFGPYLTGIPSEPVTGSARITIDTTSKRSLPGLAAAVAGGDGEGGWHYEARSGNLVANLGARFNSKYTKY